MYYQHCVYLNAKDKPLSRYVSYLSKKYNIDEQFVSMMFSAWQTKNESYDLPSIDEFNQYVKEYNDERIGVQIKKLENKKNAIKVCKKIGESVVIWAHPSIGKTYAASHGNKFILDFDSEYKKEFGGVKGAQEMRRKMGTDKYYKLLDELFEKAKKEAIMTNRRLFVSDMHFLRDRGDDLDMVIDIDLKTFISNSHERGDNDDVNIMSWKESIDNAMSNTDEKKYFKYNGHLNDILPTDMIFAIPSREYEMQSGGATGSDTYWGEMAINYGVGKVNHWWHRKATPNGNIEMNEEDFNEGKKKVEEANKILNRKLNENYIDLLSRDWNKVAKADAVFAIGIILNTGEKNQDGYINESKHQCVDGGTGWAVEMAIQAEKSVYVYDPVQESWYFWNNNKFVPTVTPTLTKSFAGIGVDDNKNNTFSKYQNIKTAIQDVFRKTFPSMHSDGMVIPKPININPIHEDFTPTEVAERTFRISKMFSDAITEEVYKLNKKTSTGSAYQDRKAVLKLKGKNYFKEKVKEEISARYLNKEKQINMFKDMWDVDENDTDLINLVDYRMKMGKLMLKNFDSLYILAENRLKEYEPIDKVDDEVDESDESNIETILGGYTENAHETSTVNSLDKELHFILSNIYELDENDIPKQVDMCEEAVPKNFNEVHAIMLNIISKVTSCDDMIDSLEKNVKKYPWIQQILDVLLGGDTTDFNEYDTKSEAHRIYDNLNEEERKYKTLSLQARFWTCYHKVHVLMGEQNYDGNGNVTNKILNKTEGVEANLDRYKFTVYNGSPIRVGKKTYKTLYKHNGLIDSNVYDEMVELYKNNNVNEYVSSIVNKKDDIINVLQILLRSLGVNHSDDSLVNILNDENKDKRNELYMALKEVYGSKTRYVTKLENANITVYDGMVPTYKKLADVFDDDSTPTEESSARFVVDNKRKHLFSHIFPNKINTIFNILNNIDKKSDEEYKLRLQKIYLYNWMFVNRINKNGSLNIRNKWLNDLYRHPELRGKYNVKYLVSSNEISYKRQNYFQSAISILNEYFHTDIDTSKGAVVKSGKTIKSYSFSNYYVSSFSDSSTMYFVSGRKYDFTEDKDEFKYAMREVFMQEIDRINILRCRYKDRLENKDHYSIDSYDIKNEKDLGGARFVYFTPLNDNIDEVLDSINKAPNKETLIDNYIAISIEKLYSDYVKNLNKWKVLSNKNSPYYILRTETWRNSYISNINTLLKSNPNIPKDVRKTLSGYIQKLRNNLLNDVDIENIKSNVNTYMSNYSSPDSKFLDFEKPYSAMNDMIFDFYRNNFFAQTQISELTMIDPAFLKDTNKYQKRYKQFYTPYATCYNTHYMYDNVEKNNINNKKREKHIVEDLVQKHEYSIILKDNILKEALSFENIKSCIQKQLDKNNINKQIKDTILEGLSDINTADGECYRCLSSWEKCLNMTGSGDNIRVHEAIKHLQSENQNEWTYDDYMTLFEIMKGFVSAYTNVESHLEGTMYENNPQYKYIKTPIQHKNSEFLLLSMYVKISGILGTSEKLRGINEFMETHGIDKIQFESAVKVGGQVAVDINGCNTKEEVINQLEEVTGLKYLKQDKDKDGNNIMSVTNDTKDTIPMKAKDAFAYDNYGYDDYNNLPQDRGNRDVICHMKMDEWGISTSMPEHMLNAGKSGISTQALRVVEEDIPENGKINFKNKKLNKKQWLHLYNIIFMQNVLDGFNKVSNKINDNRKLAKYLQDQINSQSSYSQDLLYHIELDENNNFKYPLFDPLINDAFESSCSSLQRKEITKQLIKNAALPQVTSYGVDKDLSLRFNDENGNLILTKDEYEESTDEELKKQYPTWDDYLSYVKNHSTAIAYMEVAMPIYDKNMLNAFLDKKTGLVNYEKLYENVDESLLHCIACRVPLESKHSIVPIKIKKFIPSQNSSCVIVPPEWIAISGSDHDGDKLYVYFYENRKFSCFDKIGRQKLKLYYSKNPILVYDEDMKVFTDMGFTNFEKLLLDGDYSKLPQDNNHDYRPVIDFAEKHKITKFNKIDTNYDNEEVVRDENESDEDYENRKSDLYVKKIIDDLPNLKMAKRNNLVLDLITSVLQSEFNSFQILIPGNFPKARRASYIMQALTTKQNSENEFVRGDDNNNITRLFSCENSKEVKSNFLLSDENLNLCSPDTRTIHQIRNMAGRNLISIYASYRNFRTIIELVNLGVPREYRDFSICGNKSLVKDKDGNPYFSMGFLRNTNGEYITDMLQNLSGASVDNAKETTLSYMGQNSITAPITCFLLNIGYSLTDVSLFVRQPVIEEIVEEYMMDDGRVSIETIVKNKINEIQNFIEDSDDESSLSSEEIKRLDESVLATNIAEYNNMVEPNIDFLLTQGKVLEYFQKILILSKHFSDLNSVSRGHTQNGSASSDAARNMNLYQKLQIIKENPLFINEEKLIPVIIPENAENDIRDSLLPMDNAFRYYGIEMMPTLHKKFSFMYNDAASATCELLAKKRGINSVSAQERKDITNAVISYMMSQVHIFSNDNYRRNITMTYMPLLLSAIKKNVADDTNNLKLAKSNNLINDMYINIFGNRYTKGVSFMNITKSSRYGRDTNYNYSYSWESLYEHGNEPIVINDQVKNIHIETTYRELADELLAYCFFVHGLNQTNNDFISFFPKNKIGEIEGYVNQLKAIERFNYNNISENILDQYIANNCQNNRFVKTLSIKKLNDITNNNGIIPDILCIDTNELEKNAIRRKFFDNMINKTYYYNGIQFYSLPYIVFNEKDIEGNIVSSVLYKGIKNFNTQFDDYKVGDIVYKRMNILGNGDNLQEYEYGKNVFHGDVNAITSIIPSNNINSLSVNNSVFETELNNEYENKNVYKDSENNIVITPMVLRNILKRIGIKDISVVKESEQDVIVYSPATHDLTGAKYCKKI